MNTVQYTSLDPLSPEYPSPILIDDTLYSSPASAIEDGKKDPETVLSIHVASHRDLYRPYRTYTFIGAYSSPLENMVREILLPKKETSNISRWTLFPLGADHRRPSTEIPFITVSRPIMLYDHLSGGFLQPRSRLRPLMMEEYNVYMVENGILLYVGKQGMFLLIDDHRRNLDTILDSLRTKE